MAWRDSRHSVMSDVTEVLFEQTSCDVTSNVMSQQT